MITAVRRETEWKSDTDGERKKWRWTTCGEIYSCGRKACIVHEASDVGFGSQWVICPKPHHLLGNLSFYHLTPTMNPLPIQLWVLPPKPGNPFPKTPNCPAEMDVDSLAGPALSCLGWAERERGCWLYRPSVKPYVHRRSGHPSKVPKALANCSSQKSQVKRWIAGRTEKHRRRGCTQKESLLFWPGLHAMKYCTQSAGVRQSR